ncbi:MAG: AraC family ligand binding domain-containing protein [Ginsengibacter sp.]
MAGYLNRMIVPARIEDGRWQVSHCVQAVKKNSFHSILLITGGRCKINLGVKNYLASSNDLIIIPEGAYYQFAPSQYKTGFFLDFHPEYLFPLFKSNRLTESFLFFERDAEHLIKLLGSDTEIIGELFAQILREPDSSPEERHNVLRYYIGILLLKIKELFLPLARSLKRRQDRQCLLSRHFQHLV